MAPALKHSSLASVHYSENCVLVLVPYRDELSSVMIFILEHFVFNNIIHETVHVYRGYTPHVWRLVGVENVSSHYWFVLC
jgi:hypothetical protein